MKAVVLALAMLFGGASMANSNDTALLEEMVARNGNDTVVVHLGKKCDNQAVLSRIPDEAKEMYNWRKGQSIIEGQTFAFCWVTQNGVVFMLYEDGDVGQIPETMFRPIKTT